MSLDSVTEEICLPHHQQKKLCTTRLPYRQGRKLTAVKVYTVNNESNHLLVFGVPALNLRQETKALFLKFGNLIQFNLSPKHVGESFTETYHAIYEKIQSARLAKRMLDTKNFYGGSLHVCYAPELETFEETYKKIQLRQKDVLFRLRNLQKETDNISKTLPGNMINDNQLQEQEVKKLNMGEVNTITICNNSKDTNKNKRKYSQKIHIEKKIKPKRTDQYKMAECKVHDNISLEVNNKKQTINPITNTLDIEVIDCTSVEKETITNINESLNYNTFGNEVIKKIPEKPVNKIKFNITNKTNVT